MQNIDEQFEPMIGFEGIYEINRIGQIRAVRILKDHNCLGYRHLNLSKNGRKYTTRIHRALAIQYIPNPENKPYINHKNGIRDDNRLENLEWCTQSENVQHGWDTGLVTKGNTKLSNEDIISIFFSKERQIDLAKSYKVCKDTINAIKKARGRYNWLKEL